MIRSVTSGDAGALCAIYVPYVERTPVTFETAAPGAGEMAKRIAEVTATYPWLVHEEGGVLGGYAYASQHRVKPAYRWSVDVSIYVREGSGGRGIGRALYDSLLPRLAELGYANAFAGITLPNAASVALHERFGFRPIGVYAKVGFKLGAWHDVGWWQKTFAHPAVPQPPLRNS
jgi:phosphinothricin acetyltransferase